MDIRANLLTSIVLQPGTTTAVPTGLFVQIPPGWEIQIRSRSGLASKGILVGNGIGTVDSDYRGELKVLLNNTSKEVYTVGVNERIGQIAIKPVYRIKWVTVSELDETDRGERGFGSTGRH
jgi:dUTP pyrophosphatase